MGFINLCCMLSVSDAYCRTVNLPLIPDLETKAFMRLGFESRLGSVGSARVLLSDLFLLHKKTNKSSDLVGTLFSV